MYAEANGVEERKFIFTGKISELREEADKASNDLKINIDGIRITMIEENRKRIES